MEIIDFSSSHPNLSSPIVATVGFFDGVHIGHQHLIRQVQSEAKRLGLPSAVITFPVHPRKVLQQDYQPKLLCGFKEKLHQLSTTQVDYIIVLPFTIELSQLSAETFIHRVLKERLNVHTLFVGHDHRFGHNREAGFSEYCTYGKSVEMNVIQATELKYNEREDVSSSQIRRLLAEGNVVKANALLSYTYQLSGKIVEGYQVGRTIGFPTANIQSWEKYKVIPHLGVYAVHVHTRENRYKGMLYIGTRPTLHNHSHISVEVNIFDFEGDLYNQSITVDFIEYVRPDEKFTSMDELVKQIRQDKEKVIHLLNTRP